MQLVAEVVELGLMNLAQAGDQKVRHFGPHLAVVPHIYSAVLLLAAFGLGDKLADGVSQLVLGLLILRRIPLHPERVEQPHGLQLECDSASFDPRFSLALVPWLA